MDVNIISNCCAGATLYKNYLNMPYNNPFVWAVVYPQSIFNLFEYFYDINWMNIKIQEANLMVNPKTGNLNYKISVDNLIDIFYIHYQFKYSQLMPYDTGVDVFYNKIWEYVIEKYITRTRRMCTLGITPSYFLCDNKQGYAFTQDDIDILLIPRNIKIVIATSKDLSHYAIPNNVMIISHDGDKHIEICEQYHNDIIKFLNSH